MTLKGFVSLLSSQPSYCQIVKHLREGREARTSIYEAGKSLAIAAIWSDLRSPLLVITPRQEDARRMRDQLSIYLGNEAPLFLVPEPDVLPFERLAVDVVTSNQRLMLLDSLCNNGEDRPTIVVASLWASVQKTLPKSVFADCSIRLTVGQLIQLRELSSRWVNLGYRREEAVEIPGTFSIRGGIVDIFPPNSPLPIRLDLAGNEIENLHLFDPSSQRSVEPIEDITIAPAQEVLPLYVDRQQISDSIASMDFRNCSPDIYERIQDDLASLFAGRLQEELSFYNGLINGSSILEYLKPDGVVVLDRDTELETEASSLDAKMDGLRRDQIEKGNLPDNFPVPHISWDKFKEDIETIRLLRLDSWGKDGTAIDFKPPPFYQGRLDQFSASIRPMLKDGHSVTVVTRHANRLTEILSDVELGVFSSPDLLEPPNPHSVHIISGSLDQGWVLPLSHGEAILLTDYEVFGTVKERRTRTKRPVKRAPFLSELEPGSYVVHQDHGIARFSGTTNMTIDDEEREYLELEYAENDKLYLPTDHLDRISSFVATSDTPPTLTRLTSTEWARAKEKVKASTQDLAKKLLDLYAERQLAQGHSFSTDQVWQHEMEDAFPFEETPDQVKAVRDVKNDMEDLKPMDRLVCGDVGYGKTEVALRAAFKAVADNMQVALLVPTTILAQQHYLTFSNRLSPYPITVEVLSRFRSPAEQSRVADGIKLGTVDIVIGTHRILQKDIRFKNLGLVIVDEEQRFGVGHKELLKGMRQGVDVLTLSATPIPRTLYMALAGIRDMSAMETPPEERFPVKTYVGEHNDQLVKEAIIRELDREGQVFYLHNRINSIHRIAGQLAQLVPAARIGVAHGRMAEGELEEEMLAFSRGDIDVLVCTTIIESGLDIPNANTLIIDRADRFGLSQLYQLRGRVGRSSSRSYSYMLVPKGRRITPEAEKRLRAILEASELGSGFRIAMRDLEIRGAGTILGGEQSGHIHAVGFDLYTRLLSQAVAEQKAQRGELSAQDLQPRVNVRVDLPVSAHIPQEYISHLPSRLALYQRLTNLNQIVELKDMGNELRDRFGPLPEPVENLLHIVTLKVLAKESRIQAIVASGQDIVFTMLDPVGGARIAMEKTLGDRVRVGNHQVRLKTASFGSDWENDIILLMERIKAFQEHLAQLPLG